jgi:S1-C subfamily serine protease
VQGTGFLHKSGAVITAEHVVDSSSADRIKIILPNGVAVAVTNIVKSDAYDLAILMPSEALPGTPLGLAANDQVRIGAQITTWGFPEGYSGLSPLLCVGYVSGSEMQLTKARVAAPRLILNAAFNSGNSGGPLLRVEDGAVVGVVISKLAPMPVEIESAISALKTQASGLGYPAVKSDGTTVMFSEGQVVGKDLDHLRRQTQLVVGYSAMSGQIKEFLSKNGLEP